MKISRTILLALFFISLVGNVQSAVFDDLLSQPQYLTDSYAMNFPADCDPLVLRMEFGESEIINWTDIRELNGKQIVAIDLVYTDFRTSPDFSQPALNRQRLKSLWKMNQKIFNETGINWRFIGQTSCKTRGCAEELFHGFVIVYREVGPDMAHMSDAFIGKVLDNIPREIDTTYCEVREKTKKRREWTGMYMPKSRLLSDMDVRFKKKGIWNRRREMTTVYETHEDTLLRNVYKPREDAYTVVMQYLPDSTVMSVMDRNTQWTDIHIVCDVTGSMYPYTSQVLAWLELNLRKRDITGCTFFNDGDNKPDRKKKIGDTGGVYHTPATSGKAVESTMREAMRKGGGGDAPENNVEALLEDMDRFGKDGDIVMVADNWAPVKDIGLMTQLERPVHVILCGVSFWGVNVDYINLAYQTGGSIHTVEEDLTNLANLSEGETITVSGQKFVMKKGEFRPVMTL